MNIQIFGRSKCFATKSAQRFFKERGIKFQFVDLDQKGISLRELEAVVQKNNIDDMFDPKSKLFEQLHVQHLTRTVEEKKMLLVENPKLIKTPLVRDTVGKNATIGECLAVWKSWAK